MATVFTGPVTRYPVLEGFTTHGDPIRDLITMLEFLTAVDSAAELLRQRNPTDRDAHDRAPGVTAHARVARAFIEQALSGPESVAFVASYYAALNQPGQDLHSLQ